MGLHDIAILLGILAGTTLAGITLDFILFCIKEHKNK